MRFVFFFLALFICDAISAQYVYTIKADSVKVTGCDSSELIIENHTQGAPGFLFNTGRGRTAFKRPPTSTADPNGNVGDFSWDDNYFYYKTGMRHC